MIKTTYNVLLKTRTPCLWKNKSCILTHSHKVGLSPLHWKSNASYATLSDMKARMDQLREKREAEDSSDEGHDRQEKKEGSFHWDEFEHEFAKKKKHDWVFIAIFALPCIIVAQQGIKMLNQGYHVRPDAYAQNKYDDILTFYKKIFMDVQIEEGKPLNAYALLALTFMVKKLIENASFELSDRSMLSQDEDFLNKLMQIASTCVDQNKTARDEIETVGIQYLLNEIFTLTSLMAMNRDLSNAGVQKLIDSSFYLLDQYSTDVKIMHMSPCLMSILMLLELFKDNEFARSYFVEQGGITTLEKFIRKRAELREKIKENLYAADEEAKHILHQMKMQQEVSKEKIESVTSEKLNQNMCEGPESASIAFLLERLSSFPETNQLIRNSFPCVKHLVRELDGLGKAAASAALIRLGVPEDPKDRTPQFHDLKLNLIIMNGSAKEILPASKMAELIFENLYFRFNSNQIIKAINEIIPEASGTYHEHIMKSAILQLQNQKEESRKEMIKAFEHPSDLGKTDSQVLLFMARDSLVQGDFNRSLRYFKSLQDINPKDPALSSFLYQFCEEFQKQIMEDANLRNAIFSLDQYEACYKVKALLKGKTAN